MLSRKVAFLLILPFSTVAHKASADVAIVYDGQIQSSGLPNKLDKMPAGSQTLRNGMHGNSDRHPAPREILAKFPDYLIEMAGRGDIEGVATALNAGANVNWRSKDGDTALTAAANFRRPKLVALLLAQGANPNIASADGTPPLIFALENGDEASVMALLARGANVNPKSAKETPLIAAGSNLRLLALLLAHGCHTNGVDGNGWTAVGHAAQAGDVAVVKFLLKHHASINQRFGARGETALMAAVSAGRTDMVRLLLVSGANVDLTDDDGQTAATLAAGNGQMELARQLSHKANVGPVPLRPAPSQPSTPTVGDLISAIAAGDDARVASLISMNVDVNGHDDDGYIPLPYAVKCGAVAMAQSLAIHGADPNVVSEDRSSPLELAARLGDQGLVALLIARGALVNGPKGAAVPPLAAAALARHPGIVRYLLDHGADVNARDDEGQTALFVAAGEDDSALVRLLLDRGADPNIATTKGDLPLHQAASNGRSAIIPLLLAHGARLDALDSLGQTALDAANDGFHPVTYKFLKQAAAGRK